MAMFPTLRLTICLCVMLAAGCAPAPKNPSFQITASQAEKAMEQMRADPKPLRRPVVVIGGFLDPNLGPAALASIVRGVSRDAKIIPATIALNQSFESTRQSVIDAVDEACPNTNPLWTEEVDVIGVSLGGLVGRYCAARSENPEQKRRLKVARLFSIGGPHRGASMASVAGFTDYHRAMQPSSDFLHRLALQDAMMKYEIYAYAHLGDEMVGVENAAPVGWTVRWLDPTWHHSPHLGAIFDTRIHADICRRLRYETPYSKSPPAPLPEKKS